MGHKIPEPRLLTGSFNTAALEAAFPKGPTVQIVIEVPASELEFNDCDSSIDAKGMATAYDDDVSTAKWWGRSVEFYTEADEEAAVKQMHTEIRGW